MLLTVRSVITGVISGGCTVEKLFLPLTTGRGHIPPERRSKEPAEEPGQPGVPQPQLEGHLGAGGEERR